MALPQVRVSTDRVENKPLKPPSKRRIPMRTGLSPLEVCRKAKRLGINTVVLAFSGGKDSLAGWCILKEAGIRVIPVFKAEFPDLNLDKNVMDFYGKFFGTKVHMILHAQFYTTARTNMLADPVTVRINEKLKMTHAPRNDDMQEAWKDAHGLTGVPTAMCMKKGDSSQRMMAILRKGGEISRDHRFIYPMANASDKMCYEILVAHGCPLPSFYLTNFESRDGLRITTLDWIREHEKSDWERIKFWWPLVEAEYCRLGRWPDRRDRPRSAAAPREADAGTENGSVLQSEQAP